MDGSSSKTYYKLEIHHISVSAGDSTVIAVREDVKNRLPDCLVLIDAGKSEADLEIVKEYCSEFFKTNVFQYVILSHSHDDYHGALPDSDLFNNDTTNLVYGDALKSCFINTKYKKNTKVIVDYAGYKIDLPGASLTCYCAGGVIPTLGKIKKKYKDENDLSMAWVLALGKFTYFTAGDLSGATEGKYNNIEGPLIKYLCGKDGPLKGRKIDVLKATHHGSKYSSFGDDASYCEKNEDSLFLDALQPNIIIVPCNNSISPPLPTPEFFSRAQRDLSEAGGQSVKKIYLVNKFERENEDSYSKYLSIDYDYWETRSNIITKDIKVEKIIDEESELVFSHEIYTNSSESNELPVIVVCVDEKGNCKIEDGEPVAYDGEEKAVKIKKHVLANLPQQIPKIYFVKRDGGSYLYQILKKELAEATAKNIVSLYKVDNHGQYRLKEGIDLDIVKTYRDFIEKTKFSKHLAEFPRSLRSATATAEKYIEDYIGIKHKEKISKVIKPTKARQKETKRAAKKPAAKRKVTRRVTKK
jgi:beta-lactamase superfamily II metal-dependent hydrolase